VTDREPAHEGPSPLRGARLALALAWVAVAVLVSLAVRELGL
jgi:hypothetical protein